MDKRAALFGAFAISALAGILLSSEPVDLAGENADISPADSELVKNEKNIAFNCSGQELTCEAAKFSAYPDSCDAWYPWSPEDTPSCAENVSINSKEDNLYMVSDPANYIFSEPTETRTQTQYIDTEGSPWDIEVYGSNNIIYSTQGGGVYQHSNNSTRKLADLNVIRDSTTGLLGLEVGKRGDYLYLVRTKSEKNDTSSLFKDRAVYENVVEKYEISDGNLTKSSTLMTYPASKHHAGGRVEIGPDNKVYVTSGDAGYLYRSVNSSSKAGKIHRINKDGSIPRTNPFNNTVYSRGHRNPQGLDWNPRTNSLYASEHGSWRKDEINNITKGSSYGWSGYVCSEKSGLFDDYNKSTDYYENTPPAKCYKNFTMAPSGIEFIDNEESPIYGRLLVAGLRSKSVMSYEVGPGGLRDESLFFTSAGSERMSLRTRDIDYANGHVWVLGDSEGIAKVNVLG